MKTSGLTWDQAHNYLRTGMAKFAEYDGSRACHNVYFVHNGKLYNQYHEEASIVEKPGLISKWKLVDIPTHTLKINLKGYREDL